MNLKDSLLFMTAGILGVFLGYWLLHAADALILKTHESGDLATWFAASGTILTLGFLINQHTQLRAEQKKEKEERKVEESKQRKELTEERKKREEHEKKQQEMWAQQNEILIFQKYQIHRQEFNAILDRFELKYPDLFVEDRNSLYELIYKTNTPSNCITKVNLDNSNNFNESELSILIQNYNSALDAYKKLNSNNVEHRHSECYRTQLELLFLNLQLRYRKKLMFGDCTEKLGGTIFNVFCPNSNLNATRDLLLSILLFSDNRYTVLNRPNNPTSKTSLNLMSWASGKRAPRVVYLEEREEIISLIVRCSAFFAPLEDKLPKEQYNIHYELYSSLDHAKKLKALVSKENQKQTLTNLSRLTKYALNETSDEVLMSLSNDILDLQCRTAC